MFGFVKRLVLLKAFSEDKVRSLAIYFIKDFVNYLQHKKLSVKIMDLTAVSHCKGSHNSISLVFLKFEGLA